MVAAYNERLLLANTTISRDRFVNINKYEFKKRPLLVLLIDLYVSIPLKVIQRKKKTSKISHKVHHILQ